MFISSYWPRSKRRPCTTHQSTFYFHEDILHQLHTGNYAVVQDILKEKNVIELLGHDGIEDFFVFLRHHPDLRSRLTKTRDHERREKMQMILLWWLKIITRSLTRFSMIRVLLPLKGSILQDEALSAVSDRAALRHINADLIEKPQKSGGRMGGSLFRRLDSSRSGSSTMRQHGRKKNLRGKRPKRSGARLYKALWVYQDCLEGI